jgi:serine/threonine protein kinase
VALASGTRLGVYEILSPLGAGGMGEVYKARDTRLDRSVAIKVLPAQFATDPLFRERFEREAKAISQLTHPHICTLYDIGQQNGIAYLVMEYLEGETLERRLKNGALPLDQALKIAIEIASALDKAHRAGIVHRDLKPGNVMLTKHGAKLLDFGLAKANRTMAPVAGLSMLPTTPPNLTVQGSILGTFQYMAPEQLEGEDADARTDIFAFGAVLYEVVTGRKAFEGKSQASLISSIMSGTPAPILSLQPAAPAALDRVIRKCLAKDPNDRWQSAGDLTDELKWIATESGVTTPPGMNSVARGNALSRSRVVWRVVDGLGLVLAGAAITWGWMQHRAVPNTTQPIQFSIGLPDGWGFASQPTGASTAPIAISPDGKTIAFAAKGPEQKTLIWLRSLDAPAPRQLAGTEGASSPFWSPDSRYLAFFADGLLKKIDVTGGPAVTLCPAPDNQGGSWGSSDVIVTAGTGSALQKVSANGGVPAPATVLRKGESQHWRPSFLADGRHFIYRSNMQNFKGPFYVASLDSTDSTFAVDADSSNATYSQGYLLFLRGRTLVAQPFDDRKLVTTGEPHPVAERIETQGSNPNGLFSASANGVLAFQTGSTVAGTELIWRDRAGTPLSKLGDAGLYTDLELSPDAKRLAVAVVDEHTRKPSVWIFDIARNLRTRFTPDRDGQSGARWTHDGKQIAYGSIGQGIFMRAANGLGADRQLTDAAHSEYPDSWAPDDRSLLYERDDGKTSWNLWVTGVDGAAKPRPFIEAPLRQEYGRFSPDGRWVAYRSTESGREEIVVAPFPGASDKVQVSSNGGGMPRWRGDGKEIFYIANRSKMMAAKVDGTGPEFRVVDDRPLFEFLSVNGNWPYDVTPDGQRFVISSRIIETSTSPLTVVVNWTALLKK